MVCRWLEKHRDDGGGKDMKQWRRPGAYVDYRVSRCHFCLVPVFFRTTLQRSGGFSHGEVGCRYMTLLG